MTTRFFRGSVICDQHDPLDRGLVADYRFDHNAGLTLRDSGERGYHCDITAVPQWITSRYGPVLDFSNSEDPCQNLNFSRTDTEGSVEVFSAGDASAAGVLVVIPQGQFINYFRLGYTTNANVKYVITIETGAGVVIAATYTSSLAWTTYNHAIFTINALGNSLFLDGEEVTLAYTTGNAGITDWLDDVVPDRIRIGGATGFPDLDGKIAAVRIYNRALTLSEARARHELCLRRMHTFGGERRFPVALVTAPPVGQPMQLRGTTVPHLRQWHPRVAS